MSDSTTTPVPDSAGEPTATAAPAAPAPAAAPAAPAKSVLPLLALIFAGVSFLFAFVLAGIAWIPALVAIILAIIALVKKAQPKLFAIIAIIVAPISWLIAIIVAVAVVAMSVNNAIDEVTSSDVVVSDEKPAADAPSDSEEPAAADEKVGTRANPAALGSVIEGDEWTIVINSVTFGADAEVAAANMFNEAAPEGYHYILVNYTATYTGDDPDGQMAVWTDVEYVTPEGLTIDGSETMAVAPDAIDTTATLYSGASVTGNEAFAVPIADGDNGVLAVSPGMFANKVFVSVK